MILPATVLSSVGAISLGYLALHVGRSLVGALTLGGRREDERDGELALAASRLSVPVSIIVPVAGDTAMLAEVVRALAGLSYPEFEVIVVAPAGYGVAVSLESEWALRPVEFFYRRSLQSTAVQRFLRGSNDGRIVVVELESGASLCDRLNAGVNIARYRFISVVPPNVRFDEDALQRVLQPVLQDPKAIAGVFSHIEDDGSATSGTRAGRIHRLRSIVTQLAARLSPADFVRTIGAHGAVTVWRKDALLDGGGFTPADDPCLDLGRRVQQRSGRVVCSPQPFGWVSSAENASTARTGRATQRAATTADWPVRTAVGLLSVSALVGAGTGALGWVAALAVLPVLAFGAGLINVASLLVKGAGRRSPRSRELRSLLLVSPLEPFSGATRVVSCR